MSLSPDEVQQFARAAQAFERAARTIEGAGRPASANAATINVNAGGVGVFISGLCCAVMLTALLVGAFWVSREFNRIDSRFNDQTDTDSVQDAYIQKLRAEQKRN